MGHGCVSGGVRRVRDGLARAPGALRGRYYDRGLPPVSAAGAAGCPGCRECRECRWKLRREGLQGQFRPGHVEESTGTHSHGNSPMAHRCRTVRPPHRINDPPMRSARGSGLPRRRGPDSSAPPVTPPPGPTSPPDAWPAPASTRLGHGKSHPTASKAQRDSVLTAPHSAAPNSDIAAGLYLSREPAALRRPRTKSSLPIWWGGSSIASYQVYRKGLVVTPSAPIPIPETAPSYFSVPI